MRYVFSTSKTELYRFPTHANELVLDRSEATTSEVFVVVLEKGEKTHRHRHDDTEQIFYILDGEGTLFIGEGEQPHPLRPGDLCRIPPDTVHAAAAAPNSTLRYLAVDCFIGGRPSAEPTWDDHARAICRQQGWDYSQLRNPRD